MSLRSLAQYFEQTGDIWLADHFHQRCLETSLLIKSDGRKKEGEAHCHVGLSLENRGGPYTNLVPIYLQVLANSSNIIWQHCLDLCRRPSVLAMQGIVQSCVASCQ